MTATLESVVYRRGKTNFDMVGRSLGHTLTVVEGATISAGLLERLRKYAADILVSNGFTPYPRCVVDTAGDEGYYSVNFINEKKGFISVSGIILNKGGWPFLHHELSIDTDYSE